MKIPLLASVLMFAPFGATAAVPAFASATLLVGEERAVQQPLQDAPASPSALPTGTSDPRHIEKARALARILNSDAIIIGDANVDAKVLELVPQLYGAIPDLAALEKQYPGIAREMASAMLPITNRSARERLPQLWERQAALYATVLTQADLDVLIAFYSSPTGAKMIRVMQESNKSRHSIAEATKSPDLRFGASSALADIRETVPDILKQFNEQDEAALLRLMKSGVMGKLQSLAPKTQQLAIDWYQESAPWEEAEIESTILRVIEERRGAGK